MINEKVTIHSIEYVKSLLKEYKEENRETAFLLGMIAAYETVLEI